VTSQEVNSLTVQTEAEERAVMKKQLALARPAWADVMDGLPMVVHTCVDQPNLSCPACTRALEMGWC
jgi:hypothetical protein